MRRLSLFRQTEAAPLLVSSPLSNRSYTLRAPAPGLYRLEVRADGFLPVIRTIDVPVAGLSHLDIRLLHPQPMPVRLTLNGRPLPAEPVEVSDGGVMHQSDLARLPAARHVEAWVWLIMNDDRAGFTPSSPGTSDEGITNIPPPENIPPQNFDKIRKVRVEVRTSSGCGFADLDGWSSAPLKIGLKPGLQISGTVRDGSGKGQEGAFITADRLIRPGWTLRNTGQLTTTANKDGHFTLAALFPEMYRLTIRCRDGKQFMRDVVPVGYAENLSFGAGDPKPIVEHYGVTDEIPISPVRERLEPQQAAAMPVVTGRVVDWKTGEPIGHASLWILPGKRWDGSVDVAWTDADGRFRLVAPHPGSYRVGAEGSDQYRSNVNVDLPAGSTTTLIRLIKAHPLKALVQGTDGKPLTEGSVSTGFWISIGKEWAYDEGAGTMDAHGLITLRPPVWLTVNAPEDLANVHIAVRSETRGCGRAQAAVWPTAPMVVRLEPGISLRGVMLEPGGQPTRGGNVQVYGIDYHAEPVCRSTANTGEGGKFEIPHLLPGRYHLFAYNSGANYNQDVVVPLPGGDAAELKVQLAAVPRNAPP